MNKYANRHSAGKILARALSEYATRKDLIVLALPRGGVPVAYEVAKALNAPLDVFLVRKIGVPGHEELAMGAIATGNISYFNEEIINDLAISPQAIAHAVHKEQQELQRREIAYRGTRSFPEVTDKTVILVDDGIATGATMIAAVKALETLNPISITIAVPVVDQMIAQNLKHYVDEFVCPRQVAHLYGVGAWYDDFDQIEDEEVLALLNTVKI